MMTRIQKARLMAGNGFARVAKTDKNGRPSQYYITGSAGKQYLTGFRTINGRLSVECLLDTGCGHINCKGATKTICYHGLIALMEKATASGYQVTAICKNQKDADLRARIGGQVFPVDSFKGGRSMYVVIERSYTRGETN